MSVAQTLDINSYRLVDPRLSQKQDTRSFQIACGASQSTVRREQANSSNNNSTITFQITPNSPNNVVDRCMVVENKFTLSNFELWDIVNEAPYAGTLLDFVKANGSAGAVAPRSFSNIVASTNLSINGLNITQETRYLHHVFSHFLEAKEQNHFQTVSPNLMHGDYHQDYNNGFGSVYNELAERAQGNPYRVGRGAINFSVVGNTIEFTSYDLITMSPMVYDSGLYPGFTNVTSLQLSFTLQNLQRILANNRFAARVGAAGGVAITNFQVNIANSYVHFTELTMPVYMSVPPSVSLSYYDVQRQVTGAGNAVLPNGNGQVTSNTYQLNQIPSRVILFVKESEASIYGGPPAPINAKDYRSATDTQTSIPDAYAAIESINVNYNNQASILSSASQVQLFGISSRNGVDLTFQEFQGQSNAYGRNNIWTGDETQKLPLCGSIICLDMAKDVPADPTALPGTSVNANFSIQVNFKNTSERPIQYELTILYVYAGVLVLSPGSAFKYTSILTRDEVLNLPLLESDCEDRMRGGDFKGAYSAMKTGLGRVGQKFKRAAKDIVRDEICGSPSGNGISAAGMSAGDLYKHGSSQSGLAGGKAVSKRSLKNYM